MSGINDEMLRQRKEKYIASLESSIHDLTKEVEEMKRHPVERLTEPISLCPTCGVPKYELDSCKRCAPPVFDDTTLAPSGAKSSLSPRFDLLPRRALERVAARYEHGLKRYGRDNWRKGISDKDYCLERIAHIIGHCYKLIDKLEGREPFGDDDAGAIAWGGLFLCDMMCEKEKKST